MARQRITSCRIGSVGSDKVLFYVSMLFRLLSVVLTLHTIVHVPVRSLMVLEAGAAIVNVTCSMILWYVCVKRKG
jgi:hypothetical protein